ncbi:MAG TPA: SusC/RagA family TonB-linked outer membrane protein [Pedobacter sp.]|nr:SusC/RagA family TonB-linked outer membrane protein [Pedobacter sp.]
MRGILQKHLRILGIVFVLLQSHYVFAQDRITGTVVDAKEKSPLAGANISTTTKSNATAVADANGKFTITVPNGAMLKVTMTGYQAITISAKQGMVIEMTSNSIDMDEVVVVGYGTQKKELLTGSIVTMKMDEMRRNTPTTSLGNLLAGQMTGVRVSTPNGIPGTQPGISIRTGSSFNAQNVLYVIDGKISGSGDFNNLSPNDIDNISVLKDAASTAAYGSRASGGVVVVTTRQGTKNTKAQITYSYSTGFDKRNANASITSAVQAGELYNRINPVSDPAGWRWTQSDLDYFKGINNGMGYSQLDAVWQDPFVTTHNLSAAGGSDKIRYFVGGSYTKQGAFLQNVEYNKYNLRANITADVTKDIELFAGLTLNNNLNQSTTNTAVGDISGIYRKELVWQPDQPVWTKNGNPIDYGWIANVGAEVRGDGGYVTSNGIKPILNLKTTYKAPFLPGLSASAQFNKSYTDNRNKTYGKQYDMWVMKKTGNHIISIDDNDLTALKKSSQIGKNYIQEAYSWSNDYQLNFQINYEHSFGGHNIKGWVNYEKFEANSGGISAGRENFPVYLTDQWWAASGDRADSYASGSTTATTGRKSYLGQLFYDYKSKYLASFTGRYDGSMNFSPDKRWGFFPSGSLGWIISNENFLANTKWIDLLKFRASAGLVGNDAVGGWQWQQSYSAGTNAYFGTATTTNVGVRYGGIVNENLTWEKSLSTNIGIDLNFLKHFSASAEYYYVNTYDILGGRIALVPPTFSRSLPSSNYGEISARGAEVSLGYRNKVHEFNYYANVNASYGGAKYITRDENITYPWQKTVGASTSRINTRVVTGMLRTQADLDAFKAANPNYKYYGNLPALGQATYEDLSGPNGTPDGIIDDWDIKMIKKNNNPVTLGLNLGFSWKGFSLDASFSGNFHQYKYMNDLAGGVEWNRMWSNWYNDSWTPENPNATLPKRYSANDGTGRVTNDASTFWLKSSNFLRMRLLNVGYSIPSSITKRVGVSDLKFYFSGSNLFMISNFNDKYYDPEIADGFSYPTMKTYNFGVNLTL